MSKPTLKSVCAIDSMYRGVGAALPPMHEHHGARRSVQRSLPARRAGMKRLERYAVTAVEQVFLGRLQHRPSTPLHELAAHGHADEHGLQVRIAYPPPAV